MLSLEEERELVRKAQTEGCSVSRDRLILTHARIAWKLAASYAPNMVAAQEDLAQVGMMAIQHALTKYDPNIGKRFGGYATFWIRAYIAQASATALLVVDMPSRRFIDARMGRIDGFKGTSHFAAFGERSLDAPVTADGTMTFGDVLEAQDMRPDQSFEALSRDAYLRRSLFEALDQLKPREREIIHLRRLKDPACTLEEVGKRFGITRERVRQVELRAFQKIRLALEGRGVAEELSEAV